MAHVYKKELIAGVKVDGGVSAEVRTFLSIQLFMPAARHFRDAARAIEEAVQKERALESRMCSLASVLSAVAYMESSVNDVYIRASGSDSLGNVPANVRASLAKRWIKGGKKEYRAWPHKSDGVPEILVKYRDAARLLDGKEHADLGGHFNDARDLIWLRNALLHYRATWPSELPERDVPFFARLSTKFAPNPFFPEPHNAFWPKGVLGHGCANWAVETSEGLVRWIEGLISKP